MDRKKARMTDDPGNSGQNATIRRTQGLRAAGEVRILGRWKYFERYSATGGVPVMKTQSSFIRASGNSERCKMTGQEDNVGFLATGSGVKQFQLSTRGWFVREARSSLPSGAYPLSGCGSAPAGLRNSQPSQTNLPTLATRRRQLQQDADGEYPSTNPANAAMRRKFDLSPGSPLNP
jgi:hypothetical protein